MVTYTTVYEIIFVILSTNFFAEFFGEKNLLIPRGMLLQISVRDNGHGCDDWIPQSEARSRKRKGAVLNIRMDAMSGEMNCVAGGRKFCRPNGSRAPYKFDRSSSLTHRFGKVGFSMRIFRNSNL